METGEDQSMRWLSYGHGLHWWFAEQPPALPIHGQSVLWVHPPGASVSKGSFEQ